MSIFKKLIFPCLFLLSLPEPGKKTPLLHKLQDTSQAGYLMGRCTHREGRLLFSGSILDDGCQREPTSQSRRALYRFQISPFLRISELNQHFTPTQDGRAHGTSAVWLPASCSHALSSQKYFWKTITAAIIHNTNSLSYTINAISSHSQRPSRWLSSAVSSMGHCSTLRLCHLGRTEN